jgi:hypothetical protein
MVGSLDRYSICAALGGETSMSSRYRIFLMPDGKQHFLDPWQKYEMTLSRWDNDGGAGSSRKHEDLISGEVQSEIPQLTNAELVQLRIRVIALENLVITLLAETSERQLRLAREMATYISPRPGFTHHPLTIHAAHQMIDLIERADHIRIVTPS